MQWNNFLLVKKLKYTESAQLWTFVVGQVRSEKKTELLSI